MGDGRSLVLRFGASVAVVLVVLVLLASGAMGAMVRAGLYATGLHGDGGVPRVDSSVFHDPPAVSTALPAQPGSPVLPEAIPRPGTSAAAVGSRIRALGPVQGQSWSLVIDQATGETLYADRPGGSGIPASTLKVLTSLAALEVYGPGHRFETRVLRDPAQPHQLYLVGGGDPYLAKGRSGSPGGSSILDLAKRAADALADASLPGPLDVVIDTSRFAGPGWNPDWLPGYRDYAAETSALWVDGARPTGAAIGPREADPARVAAEAFTAELVRLGVAVRLAERGEAPAAATPLAAVESLPVENIVERVLIHSDNDAAEVLFRHVGRADGRNGSIAAAQEAMQVILLRLGAWTGGMRVVDGSGLSRANLTSPRALTHAVALAIRSDDTLYRAIATGLSVAGGEGTLAGRFVEEGTAPGRGLVRAKTGTLTGIHSLAGYVRSADGSWLSYAFIVNGDQNEYATRVWLDRVTATLADCGCR